MVMLDVEDDVKVIVVEFGIDLIVIGELVEVCGGCVMVEIC